VNHEKIIEGLSQALSEIGEDILDCASELDLVPTEQMQGLISDLYAHIFLFLATIMDWIMQRRYKRMLDSFSQNFMDRFKQDIDTIKHQVERVRQHGLKASRAEIRVSRLTVEASKREIQALRNDIRVGLEEIARKHAEMVYRDRLKELEAAEARRDRDENTQRNQLLAAWLAELLESKAQPASSPLQIHGRTPSPFAVSSSHEGKLLHKSQQPPGCTC